MVEDETYTLALVRGANELLAEGLPVLISRGLLDNDLAEVVRQLEDDPLELLRQLQVIVRSDAILRDGGSVGKYVSADSPGMREALKVLRELTLRCQASTWWAGSPGENHDFSNGGKGLRTLIETVWEGNVSIALWVSPLQDTHHFWGYTLCCGKDNLAMSCEVGCQRGDRRRNENLRVDRNDICRTQEGRVGN
jgi:hypothetical protein